MRRLHLKNLIFGAFLVFVLVALVVFGFTDVWPYMREVIWQQSWHPVCPLPNGGLEFCRP